MPTLIKETDRTNRSNRFADEALQSLKEKRIISDKLFSEIREYVFSIPVRDEGNSFITTYLLRNLLEGHFVSIIIRDNQQNIIWNFGPRFDPALYINFEKDDSEAGKGSGDSQLRFISSPLGENFLDIVYPDVEESNEGIIGIQKIVTVYFLNDPLFYDNKIQNIFFSLSRDLKKSIKEISVQESRFVILELESLKYYVNYGGDLFAFEFMQKSRLLLKEAFPKDIIYTIKPEKYFLLISGKSEKEINKIISQMDFHMKSLPLLSKIFILSPAEAMERLAELL